MNGSATMIWKTTGKKPLLDVASNCMLEARVIGSRTVNVQSHIFIFCAFVIAQNYFFCFDNENN